MPKLKIEAPRTVCVIVRKTPDPEVTGSLRDKDMRAAFALRRSQRNTARAIFRRQCTRTASITAVTSDDHGDFFDTQLAKLQSSSSSFLQDGLYASPGRPDDREIRAARQHPSKD
jgi:hypothetical protein